MSYRLVGVGSICITPHTPLSFCLKAIWEVDKPHLPQHSVEDVFESTFVHKTFKALLHKGVKLCYEGTSYFTSGAMLSEQVLKQAQFSEHSPSLTCLGGLSHVWEVLLLGRNQTTSCKHTGDVCVETAIKSRAELLNNRVCLLQTVAPSSGPIPEPPLSRKLQESVARNTGEFSLETLPENNMFGLSARFWFCFHRCLHVYAVTCKAIGQNKHHVT